SSRCSPGSANCRTVRAGLPARWLRRKLSAGVQNKSFQGGPMPKFRFPAAPSRRSLLKSAGVLATGLAAPQVLRVTTALAAYPERTVRIVVANSPGGPSDIIARFMAAALQEVIGGSVIVENKGGAGGNLGMGAVARAEPDGYTILLSTSVFAVNPSLY